MPPIVAARGQCARRCCFVPPARPPIVTGTHRGCARRGRSVTPHCPPIVIGPEGGCASLCDPWAPWFTGNVWIARALEMAPRLRFAVRTWCHFMSGVSCAVVSCRVMSCHVVSCRVMSSQAMSCCDVMPCHVVLCQVTLHHIISVISVMSSHFCHVKSYHVLSCHVASCHVAFCRLGPRFCTRSAARFCTWPRSRIYTRVLGLRCARGASDKRALGCRQSMKEPPVPTLVPTLNLVFVPRPLSPILIPCHCPRPPKPKRLLKPKPSPRPHPKPCSCPKPPNLEGCC